MEKNGAINSINKMGKIGSIILTICKIFAIVIMSVMLVVGVILLFMPKDLVNLRISGTVDTIVNVNELDLEEGEDVTTGAEEALLEKYGIGLTINGTSYGTEEVVVTDEGTIELRADAGSRILDMRDFAMICFFAAITLLLLAITLTFAEKLFKAFKVCETPFEETIVKAMKRMAIAMIPWSVMNTFADSLINSMFSNQTNIILAVDAGVLFVVFIIFMFAYIFKYGAILQQESDETL